MMGPPFIEAVQITDLTDISDEDLSFLGLRAAETTGDDVLMLNYGLHLADKDEDEEDEEEEEDESSDDESSEDESSDDRSSDDSGDDDHNEEDDDGRGNADEDDQNAMSCGNASKTCMTMVVWKRISPVPDYEFLMADNKL